MESEKGLLQCCPVMTQQHYCSLHKYISFRQGLLTLCDNTIPAKDQLIPQYLQGKEGKISMKSATRNILQAIGLKQAKLQGAQCNKDI